MEIWEVDVARRKKSSFWEERERRGVCVKERSCRGDFLWLKWNEWVLAMVDRNNQGFPFCSHPLLLKRRKI